MDQGEKIQKILDLEGINLKEFSDLASMNYDSMRAYRKNRFTLSVKQINKICEVPRFAQYRNMLLSLDEPISEDDEVSRLLDRVRKLDRLDKAAAKRLEFKLPQGQMTHVLRHTFASHFMINGGNIITLQRILGHGSLAMTVRYAHLAPDHLSEAVLLNPLNKSAHK